MTAAENATGMNTNDAPVLDVDSIVEGFRDHLSLLREVVGIYRDDCPRLLSEIREAVNDGDAHKLKIAAHTLKGSIRYFGETPAFNTAFQLEMLARENKLRNAAGVVEALAEQIDAVNASLSSLIETIDASATPCD